ncbi:hypothetical protein SMMN14_00515 [Sphaerulina musiva]
MYLTVLSSSPLRPAPIFLLFFSPLLHSRPSAIMPHCFLRRPQSRACPPPNMVHMLPETDVWLCPDSRVSNSSALGVRHASPHPAGSGKLEASANAPPPVAASGK